MPDHIISQEGYDKLQKELDHLTTFKRREIANRIQTAKDLGDLSENAEYSDAKDEQAFNEGRIIEITNLIKDITIVENEHKKNEIAMGSKITAECNSKSREFTIVSFNEADPLNGKISNESPLGLALLGKKKKDVVKVNTPRGQVEYKILKIE